MSKFFRLDIVRNACSQIVVEVPDDMPESVFWAQGSTLQEAIRKALDERNAHWEMDDDVSNDTSIRIMDSDLISAAEAADYSPVPLTEAATFVALTMPAHLPQLLKTNMEMDGDDW